MCMVASNSRDLASCTGGGATLYTVRAPPYL